MKKRNEDDPEKLDGLGDVLPAEVLKLLNQLLETVHRAEGNNKHGSKIEIVYVASGGQHVETQINVASPLPPPNRGGDTKEREKESVKSSKEDAAEGIRHCISLLMQEKHDDALLFCQQSHWQAIYRILVDKGYCRDSDFDGFDAFIRTVMPEEVNRPYKKESVKNISRTDFNKPFVKWKYDSETSGTRKPFDRMKTVARRFNELLEENGL